MSSAYKEGIALPGSVTGTARAVDLYSKDYDKENELIRAGMVHQLFSAASPGG